MCLDKLCHIKYHLSSLEIVNERGVMLLFLRCHDGSEQHSPFYTLTHWRLSWLLRRAKGWGGRLVCSSVNSILKEIVIWLRKGEKELLQGCVWKANSSEEWMAGESITENKQTNKKSCWQGLWCNPKRIDTGFCCLGASHKGAEMLRYK